MLVLHTYLYVQRNKNSSDYSKISGDCRKIKMFGALCEEEYQDVS